MSWNRAPGQKELLKIADLADAATFHMLDCMGDCPKAKASLHALRVALHDAGNQQPFVEESREALAEYAKEFPNDPL
jgi:hypothetical protein